jgi:hypothetical protein
MLAGQLALVVAALFTGAAIYNILMGTPHEQARQASRALIEKWGRRHGVRALFGFSATAIFLWAMN